jgi:quercetin dioxygenase-like cupin family protein
MIGENQIGVTVVQPGEGEYVALPGFGAVFKLSSRTNGGEVSIVEHPFEVGLLTAAHQHTRQDEHSIVLAGEIGFRSDESEVVLGPGGYITKPRGQMHAMWNAGSEPGRIVAIITPAGSRTTSGSWASCSSSTPTIRSARFCTSCPNLASWPTNTG